MNKLFGVICVLLMPLSAFSISNPIDIKLPNYSCKLLQQDNWQFCSAVRIGPSAFLTAKHCLRNFNEETKVACPDAQSQGFILSNVKVISSVPENDMALLESTKIFDTHVPLIPKTIKEANFIKKNYECYAFGYGLTTLTPDPKNFTNNVHRGSGPLNFDFSTSSKSWDFNGVTNPGDSGGPVICYSPNDDEYLLGVNVDTSINIFGKESAAINVSHYFNWINENLLDNFL